PVRDRADVWISLGTVRHKSGLEEASLVALRRATTLLAGDPVAKAQVYAKRALAYLRGGAFAHALRETATGLRQVASLESREAVAARANLRALRAEIRWSQGRLREAIRLAHAAVEDAERVDDLHALAVAYMALDAAYQLLGFPERAVYERKAVEIWAELG